MKYLIFENVLLPLITRNLFQTPSLDDKILRNFTLSNSIISVKDLIRRKTGFEIFLIGLSTGDLGNNSITEKY